MPRSKRSKLVTLAQTEKKGHGNKERIFDEVRSGLDEFKYCWVLLLTDVRTPVLQDIRTDWTGSKLILGKRKVLNKALGTTREEEYKENLSQLSKITTGVSGLLFTNEEPEVVKAYFTAYVKSDFTRANQKSPITFIIPEGIIYSRGGQISIEEDVPMSHSMEETMRNKFKIPTKIKAGKVFLEQPYKVIEKGQKCDVRQALILKTFGIAASEFKVKMLGYYDGNEQKVTTFELNKDQDEDLDLDEE
ncbi:hypothetical protein PACTADRAFT_49949 [Pachysolen tannophilus NRRL Y-2460]|uniref:Ribosome assembly factor mrt4 n=1 Tax=Pachysolen tannophilus NRRL Y-2460 TaxID=669874 RepID=A0A1E4TTZ3_PACTA|nr:hypothetical protein PACTADRAFT_49949 [Pachysolen tannophilus NRRL Y-2460]